MHARWPKITKELSVIGITAKINVNQFAELTEKLNRKKAQFWGFAWSADYFHAEILQLPVW